MTQKKIYHRHSYSSKAIILLLMLLQIHTITMLTVVNSSSLSLESEDAKSESLSMTSSDEERNSSSEVESLSKEIAAPLLTFTLRSVNNNGSLKQSNSDNNAGNIHKAKVKANQRREDELHSYSNNDNEGDNNDSNVSSESDTGEGPERRRRFGRQAADPSPSPSSSTPQGASKAISTNWGTYEEQAPVVVHSGSSPIDESDATGVGRMTATDADEDDDDSYAYGDEYQSKENEYEGDSSISYDDYEGGSFEGRQSYASYGSRDGDVGTHEVHQPSGYYRQQYYTTARPLSQKQTSMNGREPSQQLTGYRRPGYSNRLGQQRPYNYRRPQQPKEPEDKEVEEDEESTGSTLLGFLQKAKTFYDIFQAMNSAWKTVENHYNKPTKGIFPEDFKYLNQSTQTAPNTANQSVNNNTRKMNTKRLRTTRVPITPTSNEEQQNQQDTWQEKEEYRSRRSWLKGTVNDNKESTSNIAPLKEYDSQITESDLETDSSSSPSSSPSASASSSTSSSTAIAEGRYIKGDPLKGYYDFVITEGSYKFWAVFQVGTALLIIYSTFAAIYYSKVNPLVSDYDYVDYLGGGRSLSDDSDFVDMDAPMVDGARGASDGSETTLPEGVSRRRQQKQQQQQSSESWIGWLPHAGHTLQFILESIDKVYNEE